MDQAMIRRRLFALRKSRKVSQAELSDVLGFNDRQTLSDIESGKRLVAFDEIDRAARHFGVSVDYFSDPLQLAGEAEFSWRKTLDDGDDVQEFESHAGSWIATFRYLRQLQGESVNSSLTQVGLNQFSSFEDAQSEGDAISRALELGEVPAVSLPQILEDRLDVLFLYVDASTGISGAASKLGPLNVIIINRREYEGRRNFDIAHELFHLITWDKMTPRRIEGDVDVPKKYRRIEKLADNFAAGVLMPNYAVEKFVADSPVPTVEAELAPWIRSGAARFRVSGEAMKWRLKCMGYISQAAATRIEPAAVRVEAAGDSQPPLFSRRFVETIGWGLEMGHISVRRAAEVIGGTIEDLADLFSSHSLKTPFDL